MEPDATTLFTPGTSVIYTRSTGAPVLGQVVGYSELGDAYLSLCVDRDKLCTPKFLMPCYFVFCRNFCAQQCACTVVVQFPEGGGGRHLATVPRGMAGDHLPWGREGQGGGGYKHVQSMCIVCEQCKKPRLSGWLSVDWLCEWLDS